MKSTLIPEKPILLYPSLAAKVGLDESVMLSVLSDLASGDPGAGSNGYAWHTLEVSQIAACVPFWDRRDLQRVVTSLREKGIIIIASAPLLNQDTFKFSFNEKAKANENTDAAKDPKRHDRSSDGMQQNVHGKNFIAANWRPEQVTLDQLAQLNIPSDFALRQVPEFVTYWRERNEAHRSWGQKFISHTINRWRDFEQREQRRHKARPIPSNWSPREECINDLVQRHIPKQFVLDQVTEFISYWQATGEQHLSWETKFIQRVSSRWADMEAKRNVSHEEFKIFSHWRPSEDALDVMLNKSEIPLSFIEDAIAEFVIYWQEKGMTSNTWNSLFIKHVRLQWHRFKHALDNTVDAQPIRSDWQPSSDVYDILKMANIDLRFAQELIAEFVLYWKDRNELHRSWNTRFLQHVKRRWAARHDVAQQNQPLRSTRDISLEEELNDTSWAS